MPNILTDADKALENCRLYAARHRSEEWAKTIMRFCAEAGVTGSPLRAAAPAAPAPGVMAEGCNYAAMEGMLCNKCGRVHRAAAPAAPDPVGVVSDLFPSLRRAANERGIPDDAKLYAAPAAPKVHAWACPEGGEPISDALKQAAPQQYPYHTIPLFLHPAAPAAPAGMAVPDLRTELEALARVCFQAGIAHGQGAKNDWSTDGRAYEIIDRLTASPSAQAAPARGAMTEEQIEELFQSVADADDEVHIRFARAIERFHGIGTTARGAMTEEHKAVLRDLLACCNAWEPAVCVMGNVRAGDAAEAISTVLGIGTTAPARGAMTEADALLESAAAKIQAGEPMAKDEANAHFAQGLFNPTNQVYFRAGLIACREYMARFVEAQSPEIAASIRANWWPQLGPDLGGPRRINWNELVASGEDFPVVMRDNISPTLEALPIALAFLSSDVQSQDEAHHGIGTTAPAGDQG